jgi:hypothetical protein
MIDVDRSELRKQITNKILDLCKGLHENEEDDDQFKQIILGAGDALACMFAGFTTDSGNAIRSFVAQQMDAVFEGEND